MAELSLLKKLAKDTERKEEELQSWKERRFSPLSAYYALIIHLLLFLVALSVFTYKDWGEMGAFLLFLSIVACFGYFVVNPGEATLLIQLGKYVGTVKQSGFYWMLPYCRRVKLSLKKVSTTTDVVHSHDAQGDAIRLAATLTWYIQDTALAIFQVADFSALVKSKTMMVLKNIANAYPLEAPENQPCLRRYLPALNEALKKDLNHRLVNVGIAVEEAKIVHLSYSPEVLVQKSKLFSISSDRHIDLAIAILQKIEQKASLCALTDEQKLNFILSLLRTEAPS